MQCFACHSESSTLASAVPYFQTPDEFEDGDGLHLIVCVHGLDGEPTCLNHSAHKDDAKLAKHEISLF